MEELLSQAVTLLPDLLPPAAVAVGVLLAARALVPAGRERTERAAGALALAAGFVAARLVLTWLRWRPEDPWDWLPYLVVLAAAAGLIDGPPRALTGLRWAVRLAVTAGAALVLVPDLPALKAVRPAWQAGVGAAIFLLWSLLDGAAARQPGTLVPGLLAMVAGAGGAVLEGAAVVKFVQLALALGAILAACAACSWGRSPRAYARGMVPGLAVVLPGLLLNAHLYTGGEGPTVGFVLILLAPLGLWVGAAPPLRSASPRWRALFQCLAVLVPAGVAAGLSMFPGEE